MCPTIWQEMSVTLLTVPHSTCASCPRPWGTPRTRRASRGWGWGATGSRSGRGSRASSKSGWTESVRLRLDARPSLGVQGGKSTRGHILLTWRWDLRRRARQVETLYTRCNSYFDVNIICVPEYFCHPVVIVIKSNQFRFCFGRNQFLLLCFIFHHCIVGVSAEILCFSQRFAAQMDYFSFGLNFGGFFPRALSRFRRFSQKKPVSVKKD